MPSRLAGALLCAAFLLIAAPADAAQVSYVDNGEVWISTLDGSAKRSLSGPSPDEKPWQEATQSDQGQVLGVRREGGKQGQLNATRLWDPAGALAGEGTLTMKQGWSVNAYPVTLDLTPDGKFVVYGYSLSRFNGQYQSDFGSMGMVSSGQYSPGLEVGVQAATLVGNRAVGTSFPDDKNLLVQRPAASPFTQEFDPWINTGTQKIFRADVAASGTAIAIEFRDNPPAQSVALGPIAGVGGAFDDLKSCYLPSVGEASYVSWSPDATALAWKDDRGVVVAGAPVWFEDPNASSCNLSRPPIVISATGRMPSLGASAAATPPAVQPPAGGGGGGTTPPPAGGGGGAPAPGPAPAAKPSAKLAKTVKASALRKGVAVAVTVKAAGKVTVTGTVGKAVVGTVSKRVKRAGKVTLKLKAYTRARKRLGRYKGKTLKLTIKAPGGTVSLTRKLR